MLRDKMKNEEYFEKYLFHQFERISAMKERVTEFSDVKSKKSICLGFLANYYRDYINALYSAGKSYDEVKKAFKEYVSVLSQIKITSYSDYINVVAMSVLFDISISDMKLVEEYMKDKLVNLLLNEKSDNIDLLYPNEYKIFSDYLECLSDFDSIRTYMSDKWYEGCKELSWFDSHKSTEDVYTGYWSWVAGACLKIRGENDVQIPYVPNFK